MIKVLFLIHDLGQGGAEKVLVNLVNHMDASTFDITVMSLFDVGVNKQFLAPHIHYQYCFKHVFRGNSHLMKLLSPATLHKWLIRDKYDIEVSYLEGPCARIISGCSCPTTKTLTWIHCMPASDNVTLGFRNYEEAQRCYASFHKIVCVSRTAEEGFATVFPSLENTTVCYNVNDSAAIRKIANEVPEDIALNKGPRLVGVGKLVPVKAFDRLIRIHAKLCEEGYPVHSYVFGEGSLRSELECLVETLGIEESFHLMGYRTDVYKYVAKCDIFVCSSLSEGFSTAATEALIVGTPVCTVDVSGMKEMLGENNEYGVVTENNEEALYHGIKSLLDNEELLGYYKQKAKARGQMFKTEETVRAVEQMLEQLLEE